MCRHNHGGIDNENEKVLGVYGIDYGGDDILCIK